MTRARPALFAAVLGIAFVLAGCAEITPPTPGEILESPLGKSPLRLGMTQDEVRALWGEPNTIDASEPDNWGTVRETWTYEARFPGSPVNVGYAAKTRRLEFTGPNLVAFDD